jgi:L-threonylcarbamoyladenylate synthase
MDDIRRARHVLAEGGIILYPTDTIWGLGCDATNVEAVKKLFAIKKRKAEKNFILLLDNESKLLSYVKEVPEQAWTLIEFSEKPLTIIYDMAKNLPKEIIASDGSIAIRVTKDDFCKDLIGAFRKPIVSTSANVSETPAPSSFHEIDEQIIKAVDFVVSWRQNEEIEAVPSRIIRLNSGGQIQFIR